MNNHFNFEERKILSSLLCDGMKCIQIARILKKDPRAVSREIKRNRKISRPSKLSRQGICKKLDKFPFICGPCEHKYKDCKLTQMIYDAKHAEHLARYRLVSTRQGINLTEEERDNLIKKVEEGLRKHYSIYTILKLNKMDIHPSTVYKYIEQKKIPIQKIDLPYAVKYKKRKKFKKEYDYSNNKIDRSNRTFLDYLAYIRLHINEFTVQMDFLGAIKSDIKNILVLCIPQLQFPFLFIIEKPDCKKVVEIFDFLLEKLGIEDFKKVFPSILTDRDPCFSDFMGLEFEKKTGERRTNVFYCDAYKSTQKANVENKNKNLRAYFPKGLSVDKYTEEDIYNINKEIINLPLYSLGGETPKAAFIKVFGIIIFNKLFK